ncbi:hypothetical protein [Desulfosporosinus sp. BG]|uniref:hypothetical protein n=1 Tax=Desulfosporosinus sp. BG TaxID=1633135 RepID=UPI00083B974C|nr:hypothetical protein [Desulfosporosinus sp. BG]ODA42734.1 hypothetical protein DSBG_0608 [Desulfosporosinus sp. BG]
MEDTKKTLYIPVGIKTRPEYFDGFGKTELRQSTLICLLGGGMDILAFLFTQNISVCILAMFVIIAGSVMMCTKDQTNLSAVDQVKNMIHFARSQKNYPYVALDEWKSR